MDNQVSNLRRKWRRCAKVIDSAILDEIRVDKVVFDNYRRILAANPRIQKPATFHQWVMGNYGSTLVLQVRRLADDNPRSYSVRRLTGSVLQNHKLISRRAFLRSHRPQDRSYAKRMWLEYAEPSNPEVLPRSICERDLQVLKEVAARATRLVDRDIAHLDRRRRARKLPYDEIFDALEAQAALAAKYADLVGYRMPGTIMNGAYGEDWVRLFEEPWVIPQSD